MIRFIANASTDNLLEAFKKDCEKFNPKWIKGLPDGEPFCVFNLDTQYSEALRYAEAYFKWKNQLVELKTPRIDELAIFWNDNRDKAIICELSEIIDSKTGYNYVTKPYNLRFKNAALFESIEHYNKFKNS